MSIKDAFTPKSLSCKRLTLNPSPGGEGLKYLTTYVIPRPCLAPPKRLREGEGRGGSEGHSRQPKESEQDFTGRIIKGKLILTLKFS